MRSGVDRIYQMENGGRRAVNLDTQGSAFSKYRRRRSRIAAE
jgi:hypothetical protein